MVHEDLAGKEEVVLDRFGNRRVRVPLLVKVLEQSIDKLGFLDCGGEIVESPWIATKSL